MRKNVLDELDDENLSVHVVWTPVVRTDSRESVDEARTIFAGDDRVAQYYNADQRLGLAYGHVVTLPPGRRLAWDVYFAFRAGTEWTDIPPAPDFWQHQLGPVQLDGERFRADVRALLERRAESAGR